MTLRLGRVPLSTPRAIPFDRRPATDTGPAGPLHEKGFMLRGLEHGSEAQSLMDLLEREAVRVGHLYVSDSDGLVPSGHYSVEDASYEKPGGGPRKRPWTATISRKDSPWTVRQANDTYLLGTPTSLVTADEGTYIAYTATASEVRLLRIGHDLLGYYRLEADGTDSSGLANTAPVTGAPTWSGGKIANGMTVTANGQLVTPPDLGISGSSDYTLEFWARIDNAAGNPGAGEGRGLAMRGSTSGSLGVYQGASSSNLKFGLREVGGSTAYVVDCALVDNVMTHYCFVQDYTNRSLKAYRNGVLQGTTAIGTLPGGPGPSGDWEIGSTSRLISGSTTATRFRGTMDEVRFYRRPLTATEVMNRFLGTAAGSRPADDLWPREALNLPAGDWKAILRAQSRTTVTQRFRGTLRDSANGALTAGAQVTVGAGNQDAWVEVDLGTFTVPAANDGANWIDVTVQANGDLNPVWLDRVKVVPA